MDEGPGTDTGAGMGSDTAVEGKIEGPASACGRAKRGRPDSGSGTSTSSSSSSSATTATSDLRLVRVLGFRSGCTFDLRGNFPVNDFLRRSSFGGGGGCCVWGCGVSGILASIFSRVHARFSSINFKRSVCRDIDVQRKKVLF